MIKESACNAGEDLGSIPRSGRSPGGGNGNPLQYSCLENSMDGGAWQATCLPHGMVKKNKRKQYLIKEDITTACSNAIKI